MGSNEDDYSSFKIGIGVIGKIEQTLIFSGSITNKVIIGIGTASIPISVALLQGVTIETFIGNYSNNDSQTISSSTLKLGSQANKARLEFSPTKHYDRIKITLNGGLLNLNEELRIYYAYILTPPAPMCSPLIQSPLPIHYYSFDGNTKDSISNFNLTNPFTAIFPLEYENNMVCNKGLKKDHNNGIGTDLKTIPLKDPRTVSFWGRVGTTSNQPSAFINMYFYGKAIKITPNNIFINPTSDSTQPNPTFPYDKGTFFKLSDNHSNLNLYTIVFRGDPISVPSNIPKELENFYKERYPDQVCLYINGFPAFMPATPDDIYFPNQIHCTHWEPNYSENQGGFGFSFNESQIDELLIYDKAFNSMEVFELMRKYERPFSIPSPTVTESVRSSVTDEILTVSPNPTMGQITLNGNVLLLDSNISIRTPSGTEVYHSRFRSNTFNLPTNLPEGIYILTVQTKDKKVYTRKIILKK